METRVRYVVTGLFALVALLATILFLLWIQNAGDFRGRRELVMRFDGPAAGLRVGAPVNFNGVRIGEVTRILFEPSNPKSVVARALIQSNVPISRDTVAQVDSQGLVGNVQIALSGGSPEERLQWRGPNPPVLDAQPTRSLTQEARTTLEELRNIVTTNAEPLKNVIANVNTFASALARNSDRVDNILAGLEKMTGGGKQTAPRIYDLALPELPALPARDETIQLAIADPSALVMYDTQKLLVATAKGELSPRDLQWSDSIPKLVQRKMAQALDQAGLRYASTGAEAAMPDATVQTEIRAFQISRMPQPHAEITLALRVAGGDGKVIDARVFTAEAPAAADDGPQAAEAMNAAFGKVIAEITPWIGEAVSKRAEATPVAPPGPETKEAEPPATNGPGR